MRLPTEEDLCAARQTVFRDGATEGGIGTLAEHSMHKILKYTFEPNGAFHEVPLLGYVADIFDGERVTEIQTRAPEKLLPKCRAFTKTYPVTAVLPLSHKKTVRRLNPETGELSAPRKSPKTGSFFDLFKELSRATELVGMENLTLVVLLLDTEEVRAPGTGMKIRRARKNSTHRVECFPNKLYAAAVLEKPEDYRVFLPDTLPDPFTVKAFCKATATRERWGYYGVKILEKAGLIARAGKDGRAYLYARTSNSK